MLRFSFEGSPGHHQVGVFGHPLEPEIDLAQKRAALEQGQIAEGLAERPEEPGQIEVLLDDLRLQALSGRSLTTEVGQQRLVGKGRKRGSSRHRSFSTTRHRALTRPRRGIPGTMDVRDWVAKRAAAKGGELRRLDPHALQQHPESLAAGGARSRGRTPNELDDIHLSEGRLDQCEGGASGACHVLVVQ